MSDTNEMGMEAQARRGSIEAWARANGLGAEFLTNDVLWNEDGTGAIEGSLMLANTEATNLPEGLEMMEGEVVYVRADQTELMANLDAKGIKHQITENPAAAMAA